MKHTPRFTAVRFTAVRFTAVRFTAVRFAAAVLFVLSTAVCAAGAARPPDPPQFELHALGVLGGDIDTNLSCYLLGPASAPKVMIDGGSVVSGLLVWKGQRGELQPEASWSTKTRLAAQTLKSVRAICLTHAHMDHIGGFIQKSTLDLLLAFQGRPPLDIVGLPETLAALRDHAFRPPLWVDFTKFPPDNPALKYAPLAPGAMRIVGDYVVRAIEINHPDKAAAFLFKAGKRDYYLHCGDTGRCPALWDEVRQIFRDGDLKAITLECSWPADQEKLAVTTGHLTPPSFLLELNALAGAEKDLPPADKLTKVQMLKLARTLAPFFRACPVIVTHIKAADYDKTKAELDELIKQGLNLTIPEQGRTYKF